MEQCRFCLESIPNNVYVCRICGYQQPTQEDINAAYRSVLGALVDEKMGFKKWLFIILPFLALGAIGVAYTSDRIVFSVISFAFFLYLVGLYNRINRKYETLEAFENALLIEDRINERLQKKFRALQIKSSQPQSLSLVYLAVFVLGILLLFSVSNPTPQEFQAYYANEGKTTEEDTVSLKNLRRTNWIIFSQYKIDGTDKAYWGVLGTFFARE